MSEARTAFFEEARRYTPYLEVETDSGRFLVATSDDHTGKHLFVKRERPEFRALSRAVTAMEILTGFHAIDGRLFVDVGANIGTSTVPALLSQRFGSAVSCEPEHENYRLLRANLALNGLQASVRALPVAVSNRVGRSSLVVTEGMGGQHWIAVDPEKVPETNAAVTVVEVETVTLDLLAEHGLIDRDDLGMVWIDAEGHEGQVLQGAGTLVDRGVPIVLEFHPAGLEARGDRGMVQEIAEQCYTHFVDVRRADPTEPRFALRSVEELPTYADRFLESKPGFFTDLLVLRLDAEQAAVGERLPELMKRHLAQEADSSPELGLG